MRNFIALTLLAVPMAASADYLDVYDFKLKDGCDFPRFVQIVKDFNSHWASTHGYRAEIADPVYSRDFGSFLWLGRSKNAADFGKAWDIWRVEAQDQDSVAGKLNVRFGECIIPIERRGFDLY